jgi:hypothetical protein
MERILDVVSDTEALKARIERIPTKPLISFTCKGFEILLGVNGLD